jgi:hypothetical protein
LKIYGKRSGGKLDGCGVEKRGHDGFWLGEIIGIFANQPARVFENVQTPITGGWKHLVPAVD